MNKTKFVVQNVTNTLVSIPWGVEAVWAILTPAKLTNDSEIQRIAVCLFYNRNKRSRFKNVLFNHVSEAIYIISTKNTNGLHFILGGDANHLKLDSILSLRSDMRNVVKDHARLDPIINTLGKYYQRPVCYPPLEADLGTGGVPADHLIVEMVPVNMIDNKSARSYRKVTTRPMPQSAMNKYNVEMENHIWSKLFSTQSAHQKAAIHQAENVSIVEKCFPQKVVRVFSDDCPWWTPQLQDLHRKKQRTYRNERKNQKWATMEKKFQALKKIAKNTLYKRMVNDLIKKDHNQWYSQYKRLTNQGETDKVVVEEICHLTEEEQTEKIADYISAVSQEYEHLKTEQIKVPDFNKSTTPHISVEEVLEHLMMIKTKKSTAAGDVPALLIKQSADHLAIPTGFLSCHREYSIPLGQEQRKDYKLYLHWGRVHPESSSSPKITEQKCQECLSEPIAKCSD